MRGFQKYLAIYVLTLLVCVGIAAASDPGPTKSNVKAAIAPKTTASKVADVESSPAKPAVKAKSASKNTRKATHKTQVGHASWYGKAFHGRSTASGEDFDMYQLTAASRTLPMGTWIKVTNLNNGKWVIVKVNDRGPFVDGRILDLSYGAARMLNFRGVERVKIEVVESQTFAMTTPVSTLD